MLDPSPSFSCFLLASLLAPFPFPAFIRSCVVGVSAGGGWLPLHLAARRGSHQAVKMLLDQGADPVATDDSGRTAKKLAEVNNRAECVKLLEDAELQMSSQPADSNV